MREPSNTRRSFSLLGAAWIALAATHGALQLCAPRSILADPLLSSWDCCGLLATEWTCMSIALLLAAIPFRLSSWAFDSLPSPLRPLLGGARCLMATLALLALAASWSAFWLSGQFLDRQGVQFASSNCESLLGYAARIHPFLVYGLPWLLLVVAAMGVEAFPRWYRSLPPAVGSALGRFLIMALALTILVAAAGDVGHRFANGKITDPATGAVYSRGELYRLRRERNAGPLTHFVARSLGSRDPFEDGGPAFAPAETHRPIVSMESYVAKVDRDRLNKWNVIVVLIDSLRADQLRATGGVREVMPVLEALAGEGLVFTDCTTQASHTDYAAPAVFSSHYPLRSRDVYRYPKVPTYPRVMIYDVLKALGWRTALFSSQNEEWGQIKDYMQTGGLDVHFHAKSAGVAKAAPEQAAFSGTIDDAVTMGESIQWIESDSERPFFLYLNLQNSHLPYDVPRDYCRPFGPREIDFKITVGWFPQEKVETVKDIYADSLAYVDTQLGRLFRRLKERGIWERTLVVVTGDHGEAFYEHGSAAHANGVYQEVVHVPLLLRAPGLRADRDGRPAQLIDVAPGVFHLLGLPIHPSFQGEDPFAPDPRADRIRYLISDTPWKTQIGILRSGFKLIRDGDTGGSVLYDLARDPGERIDASAAHPEIVRELKAWLAAWRRAQLEYYDNPLRHGREYPPVLQER
jgi:arylsulfatase A-like enzyme